MIEKAKPPILLTDGQFDELAVSIPTEFSKFDLLLDTAELTITKVLTPIIAQPGSLREERDRIITRPTEQTVTQLLLIAQHDNRALVIIGHLTGQSDHKTREQALKRALLEGIRSHWGLLRREAVV